MINSSQDNSVCRKTRYRPLNCGPILCKSEIFFALCVQPTVYWNFIKHWLLNGWYFFSSSPSCSLHRFQHTLAYNSCMWVIAFVITRYTEHRLHFIVILVINSLRRYTFCFSILIVFLFLHFIVSKFHGRHFLKNVLSEFLIPIRFYTFFEFFYLFDDSQWSSKYFDFTSYTEYEFENNIIIT